MLLKQDSPAHWKLDKFTIALTANFTDISLMADEYIPLKSFKYLQEAYILAGILRSEGIPTEVFDEHTVSVDPFYAQALGGVKVAVRKSDFPLAKQILTKVEQTNKVTYKNVYANPWLRAGARLIDTIIMVLAAFLVTSLFILAGIDKAPFPLVVFFCSYLVLDILVYTPMGNLRGYTIGKKNLGLKIRSQKTKLRPKSLQAWIHAITKFLMIGVPSLIGLWAFVNEKFLLAYAMIIPISIPHLFILLNRKNQSLYDLVAGIIIVEKRAIREEELEED